MPDGREPPGEAAGGRNRIPDDLPLSPDESQTLVAQAREGDRSALGDLLENYRVYLQLVAEQKIEPPLLTMVGGSDVVQETFAEAHRDFPQFRGVTPQEFHKWLLQILNRNIEDVRRRYGRQKRDLNREVQGQQPGDSTSPALVEQLAGNVDSPSSLVQRQERDQTLQAAIAQLDEQYREVIELRHRLDLSFREIGDRLSISEEAARKLWERAIRRLQNQMEADHDR